MDRAKRREQSQNKFISRIKMWFQIEGRINNETWEEYLKNNRWLNKHKHNKLKRRSGMSNMEKHKANKQIRQNNSKETNIIELEFLELTIDNNKFIISNQIINKE